MCALSLLPLVRACPASSPTPGWTSRLASVELRSSRPPMFTLCPGS